MSCVLIGCYCCSNSESRLIGNRLYFRGGILGRVSTELKKARRPPAFEMGGTVEESKMFLMVRNRTQELCSGGGLKIRFAAASEDTRKGREEQENGEGCKNDAPVECAICRNKSHLNVHGGLERRRQFERHSVPFVFKNRDLGSIG